MSNSSRVTLQRGRKRFMPAGIEHMLVHLTGRRDLLTSRLELCFRGAIKRRFEREEPAVFVIERVDDRCFRSRRFGCRGV